MAIVGCTWLTGCGEPSKSSLPASLDEAIPYYSSAELKAALAGDDERLVLVEFCVPSGCFRFDEMRPQIDRLADDQQDRAVVQRVDLVMERVLASKLGLKVCPSCVAFRDGEEVFRIECPTSSDLIAAEIDRVHQSAEVQPFSNETAH